MARPRRSTLEASEPDPGFVFDADGLRALMVEKKVLLDGRVPSADTLRMLAVELQWLKGFTSEFRINRDGLDIPRREAEASINKLKQVLPHLREQLLLESRFYGEPLPEAGLKQIDDVITALREVTHVAKLFAFSDLCSDRAKVNTWEDYAARIADQFRDVMQKVNPERERLGNGHNGPVAKFLAAVIPKISGEAVTVEQVRQHLYRLSTVNKHVN